MVQSTQWDLGLLGFWRLRGDGRPFRVGLRQQRVIAALALVGAQPRALLAGTLWPEVTERRAAGSLRASVFRICHDLPGLLVEHADALALDDRVGVDVVRLRRRLDAVSRSDAWSDAEFAALVQRAELLPGWYDDWVLGEQERLREERIVALESAAQSHLARFDFAPASITARAAVSLDPLREDANALLVRILLAGGDRVGAVRVDGAYRARLAEALGAQPSPRFDALLAPLTAHGRPDSSNARLPRPS